ncbi:hypothetical protein [Streptomyces sp. NBC_01264]|uniref:hypothetical protein n=1 Tax=Streptomyces sp. NBC_01264 TaxID=2903804 RepID=UPI002258D41E|nr:hypothetical protein [Streptomyces sp. NBC_01264]MCX4780091.1 hypothetical protein [Streptomyces sp. NBC_01264]
MPSVEAPSFLAKAEPGQPVTPLSATIPTLDRVFEASLDQLTAELHVKVITSKDLTDPSFFGCVIVRYQRISIMLSPNLGEFEADFFTRYLIAQAYKLDMTPLPTPFAVEVSPLIEGVPA